jgi:hypothetical protein
VKTCEISSLSECGNNDKINKYLLGELHQNKGFVLLGNNKHKVFRIMIF